MTLGWLFEDESSPGTEEALESLRDSEAFAPAIWPFEVANGIAVAERRRLCTLADAATFLHLLSSLPIRVEPPPTGRAVGALLSLARESGLSAYDAAYLELAMREGLPLASQDRRLRDAGRRMGVAAFK